MYILTKLYNFWAGLSIIKGMELLKKISRIGRLVVKVEAL